MKRILDYFRGCCRLTLRGCDPERCLDRLLGAQIPFWHVEKTDNFTLSLTAYQADVPLATALSQRCQCETEVQILHSLRGDFYGLTRRWVLLVGMLGVIAGAIYLPNFIVAFDVEGCVETEPAEILRALESVGIGFGTWGPSIDSEQIRNELLRMVPELRWIAVNCSGLRATVLVTEHSEPAPILQRQGAANLIACADGVVTRVEALAGQAVCAPGDAVLEGQVLVSGLVNLERCTMTTRALGEVYADTRRQITVVTPQIRTQKTPEGVKGRSIYLCVGRKRIKICGSSGIFMGDCVKIIKRKRLTLPGGYTVPLGLWIETYYRTTPKPSQLEDAAGKALLSSYASRWLDGALVAGQVHTQRAEFTERPGLSCLTQTAYCSEMIARSAEIPILELEQHGTNDQRGTNGTAD